MHLEIKNKQSLLDGSFATIPDQTCRDLWDDSKTYYDTYVQNVYDEHMASYKNLLNINNNLLTKMDEDIDICGFQINLHLRIENFVNGVVLQDILDKLEEMMNAQVQDLCTLLNELWFILTDYKQRFEDVIKQAMEDFDQLIDEVVSKLAQMIPLVSVPIPQIDDPCGLYNAGLEETMSYIDSVGKNVVSKIKEANSTNPSVLSKIVMESVSDEYNTKNRIDNIIARLQ
jgi:hypothetical protein